MLRLEGSCRCGGVHYACDSHAPAPYQLCYCSICRKTAGAGGYAINLSAEAGSLTIRGKDKVGMFRAEIREPDGSCRTGTAERSFCTACGTPLWVFDPTWPELLHPFASAVDTPLPVPPVRTHLMVRYKPDWVPLQRAPDDLVFEVYPEESLEAWHKRHELWLA